VYGVVIEKIRCEGEVAGSKSAGCNVHENICDLRLCWNGHVADRWGPPRIIFFVAYF